MTEERDYMFDYLTKEHSYMKRSMVNPFDWF